jgi:hypothetical protein
MPWAFAQFRPHVTLRGRLCAVWDILVRGVAKPGYYQLGQWRGCGWGAPVRTNNWELGAGREGHKGARPGAPPGPRPNVRHYDRVIALIFELLYT